MTETGYTPTQRNVGRVKRVQADPTMVRQGEAVDLMTTYTAFTPNLNQMVTVRETREVRRNGVLPANPTHRLTRANGTFTSPLPITLPPKGLAGPTRSRPP